MSNLSAFLLVLFIDLVLYGVSAKVADFGEICAENGFMFEKHVVTTADGYILT